MFAKANTTEQLHKKPQKKDKGQPIRGPLGSIQMDLMFYSYPKQNQGYNTILTAIGINNRIGYAIPMKGKSATESARAINELIKQSTEKGHPFYFVESDNGKEFVNKLVQSVLAKYDINHITAQEGDHNAMGKIERFNRTLKAMIGKYMTTNNTTKWIDVLPQIVENYNSSYHKAIKTEPDKVDNNKEQEIMDESLVDAIDRLSEIDLEIGDKVRVPNKKGHFQKEGQNFSNGIYTVETIGWSRITVRNAEGNLLKKNYRIAEVLKVPKSSKPIDTGKIKQAKKKNTISRRIRKEGLEPNEDLSSPRVQNPRKSKLEAYAKF